MLKRRNRSALFTTPPGLSLRRPGAAYTGAKIMLDQFSKTGVEGYKIEAVYADAQSKPDVAINEAVRLIEQEKVNMLLGFFSSAQCVPVAARVEQLKNFMWITTCISSSVLDNKNFKYVFRPQASGDQFGLMTMDFIAQNAKAKFGKEPKDLRVAIIHDMRLRRRRGKG
jgi:branched-chain amino acid transport system substrate-binding protein